VQLLRITPATPRKAQPALSAAGLTEKDNLIFGLGMYGAALTPELASTLGGLRSDAGVLVLALAGVGLTGQNAIEPADVVRAVNGTPVVSVEALRSTLASVPEGAPIVVQIEREGVFSYIIPGTTPGAEQRLKKTSSTTPGARMSILKY